MGVLDDALFRIFPTVEQEKDNRESWQKAREIMDHFDVRELGERLALAVLCEIVNYVSFPSQEMAERYGRWAANRMPEILGISPDHELHMDEIAAIQMYLDRGESMEEIRAHRCSLNIFEQPD